MEYRNDSPLNKIPDQNLRLSEQMARLYGQTQHAMTTAEGQYNKTIQTASAEKAIASSGSMGGYLGSRVGAAATTASQMTFNQMMRNFDIPRGFIGTAGSESLWTLEQISPIVESIAPERTAVEAYDNYLCINGYYMDGKIYDFGANNIMVRPKFTYIKMVDASINGKLGIYKPAIEGAFNNGIRFWNPSLAGLMGEYDRETLELNTR